MKARNRRLVVVTTVTRCGNPFHVSDYSTMPWCIFSAELRVRSLVASTWILQRLFTLARFQYGHVWLEAVGIRVLQTPSPTSWALFLLHWCLTEIFTGGESCCLFLTLYLSISICFTQSASKIRTQDPSGKWSSGMIFALHDQSGTLAIAVS
jgi:hypothetical protein